MMVLGNIQLDSKIMVNNTALKIKIVREGGYWILVSEKKKRKCLIFTGPGKDTYENSRMKY